MSNKMKSATFYLLPPRPVLAQQLASGLEALLPGIPWTLASRGLLVDALCEILPSGQPGVYLVCRDELPTGESVEAALCAGYGAEDGDEVVELRFPARGQGHESRRWRITGVAAAALEADTPVVR